MVGRGDGGGKVGGREGSSERRALEQASEALDKITLRHQRED